MYSGKQYEGFKYNLWRWECVVTFHFNFKCLKNKQTWNVIIHLTQKLCRKCKHKFQWEQIVFQWLIWVSGHSSCQLCVIFRWGILVTKAITMSRSARLESMYTFFLHLGHINVLWNMLHAIICHYSFKIVMCWYFY